MKSPNSRPSLPGMLAAQISNAGAILRARWHLRHATRVAPTVRMWGRPRVINFGTLSVGDRVRISATTAQTELSVAAGGTLSIGDHTFVNYGTSISASESVAIGPRCNIGTYCMILDNDFHRLEPERRAETPPSSPVRIGENVWLGGRVIVLPGVTIGDGSVIAAGSVVTRDIPPRTLAVGVPARVVRQL